MSFSLALKDLFRLRPIVIKIVLTSVANLLCLLLFSHCTKTKADDRSLKSGPALPGIDLQQRYPTRLISGDKRPDQARPWEFSVTDVFRVSRFALLVGDQIRIEAGEADLGIGHCADGAVWALLLIRSSGELLSKATNHSEAIASIWLRFHPKELERLFPPGTVFSDGTTNLAAQMRFIAGKKMKASWQAGGRALIPEPKDLTVDVETRDGPRRFFVVDTESQLASYIAALENRTVHEPPAFTVALAESAFDQLWQAFDQRYAMFVLRPEIDWSRLRDQYRPLALNCKSTYEFASVCADLLRPLRDLHIWITLADSDVPVYDRLRTANANPRAYPAIFGDLKKVGSVVWATTPDHIGFISISGWSDPKVPLDCDEAMEQMRETRGLIVDVRLNGGGSEPLAKQFAGRFLDKNSVYAYSRYRNGPNHTNLTQKYERTVSPRGPWRYDRPVILLVGQKCMSSTESFVGMMTGSTNVTTMGDHTAGSSGNPEIVKLPLSLTVSVPKWIDYLPDGTPLDERGFTPKIHFKAAPGAFEDSRDDLLSAALSRLDKIPLPDKPIDGPVFDRATADLPDHRQEMQQEARDPSLPKIISVTPANGVSAVKPMTELHLRFDRPMDPLCLNLIWESGGFLDCEFPKYNSNTFEFTVPIHLIPGTLQQIVVNRPWSTIEKLSEERKDFPGDGFLSLDHHLAGVFAWRFSTQVQPSSVENNRPRAISIAPASGSKTPFRTFLEIEFDQSMAPPTEALLGIVSEPGSREPSLINRVEFDRGHNKFRLPLLFAPNGKTEFALVGFRSASGVPIEPIKLQYQVSDEELSPSNREWIEAGSKDPRLLELLKTMKQSRAELTSLSEHVQTLVLNQRKGSFVELRSQGAAFKWQKPAQYSGDVTTVMITYSDFRVGSDGRRFWHRSAGRHSTNFVACAASEMPELNISICDPFRLTSKTPSDAAHEFGLSYAGLSQNDAVECFLVQGWQIETVPDVTPFGSFVEWQIDRRNNRPISLTQFHSSQYASSYQVRQRFIYDSVNEPLPERDFALPNFEGISPSLPEPLDTDYTDRYISLRDGSDGRMSLRWGKKGPKGISSDGLN